MSTVTLRDGDSSATTALLGAEPQSWTVAGRDLLWRPDPRWWAQTSPVLFPVCGWLRDGLIRVDGQSYALGLHGFAPQSRFTVIASQPAEVTLELRDDAATRAVFPFAFRLRATYSLAGGELSARFSVINTGTRRLPYAIGLHPGFAWPFAAGQRDEYRLVFEHNEDPSVPIHENGLGTSRRRPIPLDGRVLHLSDAIFAPGGMVLRHANSRSVTFHAPDGAAITLHFEDLPHIVVWTRPGAPFLCIEGWTGYNDPADFAGDIAEKPGMRLLDAGTIASHAMTFAFRPAGG